MGQNKTMAIKGIKLKKVQAIILLLVLFLNLNPCIAMGLESQNFSFSASYTEKIIGYQEGKTPSIEIGMTSGATAVFNVYDKDDNLIRSGFFQGQIIATEKQYPIKLKYVGSSSGSNWSVKVSITYLASSSSNNVDLSKIESILGKTDLDLINGLSTLTMLLDMLNQKLQLTLNYLDKINDFLSNPKYLEDGANDLKNSVDNLTNKKIVSDAGSTASTLNGLNGSGSSGGFEIPLEIGGQKFNALDFSALEEQLKTIRNLMSAIMWIEFAVFCIKVVVPKFKV